MGRLLATFATILILVLAGAFAVPAFVDWNTYRSSIEDTASGLLGQKLTILGDIDIALLPEPHLRARSIAAGMGQAGGTLLTADAVDVTLSLQGLLGGRVEAGKIKLVRPTLTLDFTKPLTGPGAGTSADALPIAAEIGTVEIEGGRVSVFSGAGSAEEALSLTKIDGIAAAVPPGDTYRFTGHFSQNGRLYEAKVSGSLAHRKAIRLSGNALDIASKVLLQADGVLSATPDPGFDGMVTLTLPQAASSAAHLPYELQLKSAAKIGFTGAVLSDAVLTLDPQNRPQILTGSGTIAFEARTAGIALQARSLDAGILSGSSPGDAASAASPQEWSGIGNAANSFLWLFPGYGVNLELDAGLIQLKGEPVENFKLHGVRTARRWLFDQVIAALPGDTAMKAAGSLTETGGALQLNATAAFDGKNGGRLARWLIPSAIGKKAILNGPFTVQGGVMLSEAATRFEGVSGSLDGTPFKASLNFEKAPIRKLQLSLSGESFDLSAFDGAADNPDSLSPDSLKTAWQSGVTQIASMLGGDLDGYGIADVDISAASVKTAGTEAKNVALHVKAGPESITVSKLSAETASGLVLRGEGEVPLRGTGQGRFEGRIEARTPQAIVHAAALTGYGRSFLERRAADLAPAALSINYSSGTVSGSSAAQLTGSLGPARVEGRAQLKGSLSGWRTAELAGQFKLSEPEGNKLLALLFPNAVLAPGVSLAPGILSLTLNGNSERLETSAMLNAGALQLQLDGSSRIDDGSLSFKGKTSASSQTPEQFLPSALLSLLGGEPKANLRISAAIDAAPGRADVSELKAETPRNLVTGHLALDATGGATRIDAGLKADQASLPALLGYFLSPGSGDTIALAVPPSLGAPAPLPDLWSGRAFALDAFRQTSGRVSLTAKTLKLSDAIVLSDAQLLANLDKGKLDIESLKGQTLGGTLSASLSLTAKESTAAAEADISLAGADLAAIANPGTPPFAFGRASLSLFVAGQGLSPRGLISVLQGSGMASLSEGTLPRLSSMAVQSSADELLARQLPLTEEAVTKKVLEAVQSGDFAFQGLKIPVTVADGILEIRKAPFRGEDATVRMEAYADLNKAQVDSTWELGVSPDRHAKWPPVKVMLSGPLRELGARPRTLAAEDFARAVLVRKMEGDISRLESLNKPSPAVPAWTATQEPAASKDRKTGRSKADPQDAHANPAGSAKARPPIAADAKSFEQRMRDALQNGTSAPPAR